MADDFDSDALRAFLFRRYPLPPLTPVSPEDEAAIAEAAMAEIEAIVRTKVLPYEPAFRALGKRQRARSKAGGSLSNILSGDDITPLIKAVALEDARRLVHRQDDDPQNELAFADASAAQRFLVYAFERLALSCDASGRVAILDVMKRLARDISTTAGKASATLDRGVPATLHAEQRGAEIDKITQIARGLLERDKGRKKSRSQLQMARLILVEQGHSNPTTRACKTLVERCRRAGIPLIVPR